MTNLEIISETPVTMSELKDTLKVIKKRDEELNFRAERTEDYLQQFTLPKSKDAKALVNKINGLDIPRLKEEHIVKLVDLMPEDPEETKSILSGYTITVSKDNLKKITDALNE